MALIFEQLGLWDHMPAANDAVFDKGQGRMDPRGSLEWMRTWKVVAQRQGYRCQCGSKDRLSIGQVAKGQGFSNANLRLYCPLCLDLHETISKRVALEVSRMGLR